MVDFPAPLAPTKAMLVPDGMDRSRPSKTGGRSAS